MDIDYDKPLYNVGRAGLLEDQRKSTHNELSEARESALNDMLDLILHHKKEIAKIPSATTLRGAQEWCAKRPNSGYRAEYRDIGGDEDKEVVVFDKAGRPFMVNGYKLKPSDYGVRKVYWDENPTAEDRAGNPMRSWARDRVWSSKVDPKNVWNRSVSKNEEAYNQLKNLGYRMPSKPKTQVSPYSIFSKTIAPIVSAILEGYNPATDEYDGCLYNKFQETLGLDAEPSEANRKFVAKLVSPISIYRFLFMRLVEQKYYFACKNSEATRKQVTSYATFKAFLKKNKATFRQWFLENIMNKETKYEEFNSAWISPSAVLNALVKDSIQWDGSDIQDGIVFLLGLGNMEHEFVLEGAGEDGTDATITFQHLLVDGATADSFLKILGDKGDAYHRDCKRQMEIMKKAAHKSMDSYFKNERMKKQFFDDETAEETFNTWAARGLPNATNAESAEAQQSESNGPAALPTVKPATEDKTTPKKLKGQKDIRTMFKPSPRKMTLVKKEEEDEDDESNAEDGEA